ncbi:PKD domain-containing protein [Anaeromyxobacter paludicola]|uniref:PKD domain-containing protein n=1 Tax=Anaeromyxobacter paludicola TaxID=2918171 RepID=UPI0020BEACF4|nr:PKD domain-containing protein [Anaeromyxobacter paludicola]
MSPRAPVRAFLILAVFAVAFPGRAAALQKRNTGPTIDGVQVAANPVPANGSVNVQCSAHEVDGGNVRQFKFTVSGGTLPGGGTVATVDVTPATSASATIVWSTPAPGSYTITCDAIDDDVGLYGGNAWALVPMTVTVTTVVTAPPPVVDEVSGPAGEVLPGTKVTLAIQAHDPSGGSLSYAWTSTGGTLLASGATATWTAPTAPGGYGVTVTVTNAAGVTVSSTFSLPVVLAIYEGHLESTFGAPQRVAVAPSGDLYVVDGMTKQLFAVTRDGRLMGNYALPGRPVAVAYANDQLMVSTDDSKLLAIDPASGRVIRTQLLSGIAVALAYDPASALLWAAERSMNRVRAFRANGTVALALTQAGANPLLSPVALAVDGPRGVLWVAQSSNELGPVAHAFSLSGTYLLSTVGFGSGPGQVTRVGGIATDANGLLYLADIFQGKVQVVSSNGAFVATLGQFGTQAGQLQQPSDVALLPNQDVVVLNQGAGTLERYGAAHPLPACPGDSDCDGMPDWWELKNGLNPNWAGDALMDLDGDGLTNLAEYKLGTNPRLADGPYAPQSTPADTRPALIVPPAKVSDPGLVRFAASVRSGSASCKVSWKQRLGPAVTLRGADTLSPSFVGRATARYQFQGVATCGTATSAPAVLEASIRNVPPRADAGRVAVLRAGSRATLDGRLSSDANGDALGFAWDQSSGAPLMGAAAGATLSVKLAQPGFFAFQLAATDPAGARATAEAPLLVLGAAGESPTASVVSPVTAAVGAPVTLDASASFVPGAVTYQWVQVAGTPVVLSGADGPSPTFTPTLSGAYAFQLTLVAGPLRSPPARVDVYAGPGGALAQAAIAPVTGTATAGEPVTLDGASSTGAAGNGLTYAWRQVSGPAAGLTDADRAVATVVPFSPGAYVFELTVSEGGVPGLPARVALRATSAAAGQGLPVAAAAGPAPALAGTSLSLDGTGSYDPDRHFLRYRWTQTSGPWVLLDDPTSATPSFRPLRPGRYGFELEVDDGRLRSAPAAVTVTVLATQGSAP